MSKPQAPYKLAVKMYGDAEQMYGEFATIKAAEQKAVWHIDYVGRAQVVIADATGAPVRIHNGNRLEKIEGKHYPAERMLQEAGIAGEQ